MNERDLLVAFISIGLGASIIYTMTMNAEWCFRLKTPQALERSFGRRGAQCVLGLVAMMLIGVGLHLIFSPMLDRMMARKASRQLSRASNPHWVTAASLSKHHA